MCALVQRQTAAGEDVDFAAVEHFHAVERAGGIGKAAEIDGLGRSGDAGGVISHADELQALNEAIDKFMS